MMKVILIVIVSWLLIVKSAAKIIIKTRETEKLCKLYNLDGINFMRIAMSFS